MLFENSNLEIEENPEDGTEDVEIEGMNTTLRVNVTHEEWAEMNVTFYEVIEGQDNQTIGDIQQGILSEEEANVTWEDLEYGAEYQWFVNVTEAYNEEENWTVSDTWTFTTEHIPGRIREPNEPEDGTTDVSTNPELNVTATHPDEDVLLNVTLFGRENDDSEFDRLYNETITSGDYVTYTWEDREYGTGYTWYVNVTEQYTEDQNSTDSEEWTFETEHIPGKIREPNEPEDGATEVSINPELNVTATHPKTENITVSFYGNETGGELEEIHNVSVQSGEHATYIWENRSYDTNYEWYVNVSEENSGNWTKSVVWTFTTRPEMYELNLGIEGEGTITVEWNEEQQQIDEGEIFEVEAGSEVNLRAIPDEGYVFDGWTGDYQDTEEEINITMDSHKEITALFVESKQAYFEVEIIDYDKEIEEGRYLTVEYTIQNTGEVEGTQDITLSVEGVEVERREDLTLGVGEERTGKFFWQAEAGSHLITVASEDDEDTVAVNVQIDPVEDQIPGFTPTLLILATVFAVVIYHKKKE